MSIFLYFLFEVCGLYVWACASGVSYNPRFNTPLCCNIQTAGFCWISCFSFPNVGWPLFGFPPRCPCQRDKFHEVCQRGQRMLKMWRNCKDWIGECRGWDWNFFDIDSILLHVQRRITLNVTQIGRVATVCTVYQQQGWASHIYSYNCRAGYGYAVLFHSHNCTLRLTHSVSPSLHHLRVLWTTYESPWLMAAGQTFWRRIQR